MKHHIFLGGNQDELLFGEVNVKFLVHKGLIDENTRDMIMRYIVSLKAPAGIKVEFANDVYLFKPGKCGEKNSVESNENYLWFAL